MLSYTGRAKEEAQYKLIVVEKRNEQEREEERLLNIVDIFDDILNNNSPVYVIQLKFINILNGNSQYKTSLLKDELQWMAHELDCIEKIFSSKKATMVIWYLYRKKETYIQDIARSCKSYSNPIRYWIKVLKKVHLVNQRTSIHHKKKVFYHLNYQMYPNIIGTILEMLRQRHGEEYLDSLIIPARRIDNTIIDLQGDSTKGHSK